MINHPSATHELTAILMLTERELDILRLVAEGFSAKEVALRLEIAPRTVEAKLERLRLKTRTRNRTQLVASAVQHGWI